MTTNRGSSDAANRPVANHGSGLYEIKVKGHLDEHWLDWFDGMTLRYVRDEETGLDLTVLRGAFADQPALHGLLTKIRDLNLTLMSVMKLDPAGSGGGDRNPRRRPPRSKRPA